MLFGRVPELVEEDVTPDPVHVRLLGSWAVVADPDRLADQVQQLGFDRRAPRGSDGHRGTEL
jgi:hypothetical protein